MLELIKPLIPGYFGYQITRWGPNKDILGGGGFAGGYGMEIFTLPFLGFGLADLIAGLGGSVGLTLGVYAFIRNVCYHVAGFPQSVLDKSYEDKSYEEYVSDIEYKFKQSSNYEGLVVDRAGFGIKAIMRRSSKKKFIIALIAATLYTSLITLGEYQNRSGNLRYKIDKPNQSIEEIINN